MYSREKEVYFDRYCQSCTHHNLDEKDEPCNECLAQGYNMDSHKPICYKEATK